MRTSGLAPLGMALAFACTGCAGGQALELGGDPGTLCIPVDAAGHYTYGFDAVRSTADEALTVERVSLVDARNATAEGGYLAPMRDTTAIGAMPGWPPEGSPPAFDDKIALPAEVGPGETLNLVIHLKADGPAEVPAVEVTYAVDGDVRRVRNSTELLIRKACF